MAILLSRKTVRHEEGESIFVSMTDLAVSFLFIVLVLLAFFATQIKPEELENQRNRDQIEDVKQVDPLRNYLEMLALERAKLLNKVANRIQHNLPGMLVTVVEEDGIIRFRSDDMFASGQWRIQEGSTAEEVAMAIGEAFDEILPCYTLGQFSKFEESCNRAFALIETVQIEGHTDNIPLGEGLRQRELMLDNRDLSARRSAETLRAATDRHRPELREFLNLNDQPVISFAGYGAMRPISDGDTETDRAANRRIDIRFILETPITASEVEEIRKKLLQNIFNRKPENVGVVS